MTVAISTVVDFAADSSTALKIELSPSPPDVGDNIQINIYAAEAYQLMSPYGNASAAASFGAQQFQEDVDVNDTQRVTTNYPVAKLNSANHLTPLVDLSARNIVAPAGQPAAINVVNSTLSLNGAGRAGTIRVDYFTYPAQTWDLTAFPNAGLYVVFYKKVTDIEWSPFVFTVGTGNPALTSQPSIVTVQAKDFCTDLPIQGATVFVDGQLIGVTDINGKKVVGLMTPGAHSIKLQAPGYIPTDSDSLSNDSFQI